MDWKRSSANAVRWVRMRRSCAGVIACHQWWWRAPFGLGSRFTGTPNSRATARANEVLLGTLLESGPREVLLLVVREVPQRRHAGAGTPQGAPRRWKVYSAHWRVSGWAEQRRGRVAAGCGAAPVRHAALFRLGCAKGRLRRR